MFQKTGNYCFVACLASVLLDKENEHKLEEIGYDRKQNDENYNRLQELIVEKFPKELQKGGAHEGIPDQFPLVIFDTLGLSKDPIWKYNSFNENKDYLLKMMMKKPDVGQIMG